MTERNFYSTDERLRAQRITPRSRPQHTQMSGVGRQAARTANKTSMFAANSVVSAARTLALPEFALPSLPSFVALRRATEALTGSKSEIRRRGGMIPAWVFFGMFALGAFALCVSANVRAYAEHTAARAALMQEQSAVEKVGSANAQLTDEVQRLKDDPQTIENEARAKLNMVRRNEIIVSAQ